MVAGGQRLQMLPNSLHGLASALGGDCTFCAHDHLQQRAHSWSPLQSPAPFPSGTPRGGPGASDRREWEALVSTSIRGLGLSIRQATLLLRQPLCMQIQHTEDMENEIDELLQEFEEKSGRAFLHTVCFY